LVAHFVARFNAQLDRTVTRVAPQVLTLLQAQPWPGNVRELRNVVENMVLFCSGDELTLADLPPEYREGRPVEVRQGLEEWAPRPMAEIEREAILRTLELTKGHRARAAQLLGIGLRTLQRKLKEYGAVPAGEEIEE
jgi:DNA-binding NtrC family response regulator